MSPSRKISVLILAIMAVVAFPHQVAAGTPTVTSLTQTFRNSGQDQNGVQGDYFTSYTAVTWRSAKWSLRGSMSWLSWRDGGGSTSIPDGSGPGSVYLTVGRRVWQTRSEGFASSGWLRLGARFLCKWTTMSPAPVRQTGAVVSTRPTASARCRSWPNSVTWTSGAPPGSTTIPWPAWRFPRATVVGVQNSIQLSDMPRHRPHFPVILPTANGRWGWGPLFREGFH